MSSNQTADGNAASVATQQDLPLPGEQLQQLQLQVNDAELPGGSRSANASGLNSPRDIPTRKTSQIAQNNKPWMADKVRIYVRPRQRNRKRATAEQTPEQTIVGARKNSKWTDENERILIDLWRQHIPELRQMRKNRHVFQVISASMEEKGHSFTWEEVQMKVNNLLGKYRKHALQQAIGTSPSKREPWIYFDDVRSIDQQLNAKFKKPRRRTKDLTGVTPSYHVTADTNPDKAKAIPLIPMLPLLSSASTTTAENSASSTPKTEAIIKQEPNAFNCANGVAAESVDIPPAMATSDFLKPQNVNAYNNSLLLNPACIFNQNKMQQNNAAAIKVEPNYYAYMQDEPENLSMKTQSMVADMKPMVPHINPMVSDIKPVVSHSNPMVTHLNPMVSDIKPMVSHLNPMVSDIKPTFAPRYDDTATSEEEYEVVKDYAAELEIETCRYQDNLKANVDMATSFTELHYRSARLMKNLLESTQRSISLQNT